MGALGRSSSCALPRKLVQASMISSLEGLFSKSQDVYKRQIQKQLKAVVWHIYQGISLYKSMSRRTLFGHEAEAVTPSGNPNAQEMCIRDSIHSAPREVSTPFHLKCRKKVRG